VLCYNNAKRNPIRIGWRDPPRAVIVVESVIRFRNPNFVQMKKPKKPEALVKAKAAALRPRDDRVRLMLGNPAPADPVVGAKDQPARFSSTIARKALGNASLPSSLKQCSRPCQRPTLMAPRIAN